MLRWFETTRRTLLIALSGAPAAGIAQAFDHRGAEVDPQDADSNLPAATCNTTTQEASAIGFRQSGKGAVRRTIEQKLNDVLSVSDYGAIGDSGSQAKDAFTSAASALAGGGPIDITAGTHLVGEQVFGPGRGNIHSYDYAIIGKMEIIANESFMGRPAVGWTLVNFDSTDPYIHHSSGKSASAKYILNLAKYTTYLITITLDTTVQGGLTFYLSDRNILTGEDYSIIPVGKDTYQFSLFSYLNDGATQFELRSDIAWAGSVEKLSVIKVEREAPYDFFSISSDKKNFDNIFGIKFGRFLSGNIGIGDRLTSSLLSSSAAWNIAVGSRALSTNVDGFENTAIGAFTLEYNQVDRNTAGGYSAFRYNTKGIQNTGWGYKTFGRNSVGSNNTGVGFWASLYNQTGSYNSSFGTQAAYYNCHGNYNSSFGFQSGLQNDGGIGNTYVGAISGPFTPGQSTFSYNYSTCVGSESKVYGDNNTAIGHMAQCGSNPYKNGRAVKNATSIGYGAACSADDQITLGNTSIKAIRVAVGNITVPCDRRDQENLAYIDGAFASKFIKSLKPARWDWKRRGDLSRKDRDIGLVAQDLLMAQTEHNASWLGLVDIDNLDFLEATPGRTLPIVIAALKHALERIEFLEKRL